MIDGPVVHCVLVRGLGSLVMAQKKGQHTGLDSDG